MQDWTRSPAFQPGNTGIIPKWEIYDSFKNKAQTQQLGFNIPAVLKIDIRTQRKGTQHRK